LSSLTVVIGGNGAINRKIVACVGNRTPGSSCFESQASSTIVISGATAGHKNASVLRRTPFESSVANTFTSGTIVIVGASCGDVVTSISSSAPGGS